MAAETANERIVRLEEQFRHVCETADGRFEQAIAMMEVLTERLDKHNHKHDGISISTADLEKRVTIVELAVKSITERLNSVAKAAWGIAFALGVTGFGLIAKSAWEALLK